MERLDPKGGIGLHLSQDEAPELARNVLETPDLGREVVLQELDDPPISLSEYDSSDSGLVHWYPLQSPFYRLGDGSGNAAPANPFRIGAGARSAWPV